MNAIISLTTIPDRIERIGSCLESLVAQGLPVYLWAVEKIARSETVLKAVPDFPGVRVRVVPDCGPITKLLPALHAGHEVIITADDDCVYGEGWAAGLLDWAEKLPGAALAYRGRILKDGRYSGSELVQKHRIQNPRRVDVLTGVYGALYYSTMFGDSIYKEWRDWCSNDDLVIAAHLTRRGVPLYVVPGRCTIDSLSIQRVKPLYRVNRRGSDRRNDQGVARLGLGRRLE